MATESERPPRHIDRHYARRHRIGPDRRPYRHHRPRSALFHNVLWPRPEWYIGRYVGTGRHHSGSLGAEGSDNPCSIVAIRNELMHGFVGPTVVFVGTHVAVIAVALHLYVAG